MVQSKDKRVTIGIVLSSVPKYSETFFKNKIQGLLASHFNVILFVEYRGDNEADYGCKVVAAPSFSHDRFFSFMQSLWILISGFLFRPKRCFKLYVLNKKDNLSTSQNLKIMVLNQFLLKEDLDWLHFGYGMLTMHRENIAEALNARMGASFRGADLYLTPIKHPNCYDKLWEKKVKYHVLSKEMKQTLFEKYKVPYTNIKIITPAIDIDFFNSQNEMENNDEKLKLITVARLHWKKGLEYTLEALSMLKKKGVDFSYVIVGEGLEKERLVFAVHQLDIKDKIEFVGSLPQYEVKQFLEASDIYLQYSIQEGFCNAVLEAQALGLLCIASDAEGLQENIINNETGWIVPKRQPQLLVDKIIEVNSLSLSLKQKISQSARDRVRHSFNLEKQHELFVNFFSD